MTEEVTNAVLEDAVTDEVVTQEEIEEALEDTYQLMKII